MTVDWFSFLGGFGFCLLVIGFTVAGVALVHDRMQNNKATEQNLRQDRVQVAKDDLRVIKNLKNLAKVEKEEWRDMEGAMDLVERIEQEMRDRNHEIQPV